MPRSSKARVVARPAFFEQLLEHFDARDHRLAGVTEADDFHFLADLADARFDTARNYRAAALNREDVFDRHQERLVGDALRNRNVLVHRFHQLFHRLHPLLFAVQGAERGHANDRQIVAGKLILRQQLANFQLDELEQFGVFHHVDLVQGNHDVRHTDLAGEQDVLTRLRHGAVRRRDHQDRAVHLRRARDHVLDVVGVTGAIDVRVVPVLGLVLDVRGGNCDTTSLFFRRVIDRVEIANLHLGIVLRQRLGDRCRQRRLAVVNVSDRPDVDVRFAAVKFFFRHSGNLCSQSHDVFIAIR
jgi:hypothetical protein